MPERVVKGFSCGSFCFFFHNRCCFLRFEPTWLVNVTIFARLTARHTSDTCTATHTKQQPSWIACVDDNMDSTKDTDSSSALSLRPPIDSKDAKIRKIRKMSRITASRNRKRRLDSRVKKKPPESWPCLFPSCRAG